MAGIRLWRDLSGLYLPSLPNGVSLHRWGFSAPLGYDQDQIVITTKNLNTGTLCLWGGEPEAFPPKDMSKLLRNIHDYQKFPGLLFFRVLPDRTFITNAVSVRFGITTEYSYVVMAPPIVLKADLTGYHLTIPPRSRVELIAGSAPRVEFFSGRKKVLFERVDPNVGIEDPENRPIDGTLSLGLDYSERAGQTDLAATLRFRLSLTAAQLEELGFGLRYSWLEDKDNQIARLKDFTILKPWDARGLPDAKLILDAVVDPFNHRQRDRTRFAIPRRVRLSHPRRDLLQVLKTTVPTTHGVDLLLVPTEQEPAPRFVFIKHAHRTRGDGLPEFDVPLDELSANLAPDGVFELQEPSLDDANGRVPLAQRDNFGLLTGMSDREFIRLDKDDQIRFRPDGPAYDPNWALEERGSAGPLRPAKLYADPLGQTSSWVSVLGPAPDLVDKTTLVSESTDLALYQPDDTDPVALKGHYRPVSLQVRSGPLGLALPIVPYLGLPPHPSTALIQHFEKRTVVPYRRGLVAPIPIGAKLTDADTVQFTPLGFLVSRTADGFSRVLFARTPDAMTPDFAITTPSPDLVNILERDELFMVITGLAPSDGTLSAGVDIAGWRFKVDVNPNQPATAWDPNKPVVIIKGARGTLDDLVSKDGAWAGRGTVCPTDPNVFGARELRKLLLHDEGASGDPTTPALKAAYATLDAVQKDPNWMGVLVLNCSLDLVDLPDQIQAILGGIDAEKFRAHHIGLALNRLKSGGNGSVQIATSPLFGVIDYVSPDKPTDVSNGYGLVVARLVVGFANSKISAFFAKVLFLTSKFFEAPADDSPSPRWKSKKARAAAADKNVITILGTYETRLDSAGNSLDIYKFVSADKYLFTISGQFIKTIQCDRVTLSTKSSQKKANGKVGVVARIGIDGSLTFGDKFPSADITLAAPNIGCSFLDMGIEFEFDLPSDSGKPNLSFYFRPGGLSIDLSNIQAKGYGLLSLFPFKLRSFEWWGDTGVNLAKLGYFPFIPLKGSGNDIDSFKYGLSFDLDLGSLGDLGANLKAFQLHFLIGWKEDSGTKITLGFKFDGYNGTGLDIGIGNVLRFKADSYGLDNVGDQNKQPIYIIYAVNAKMIIFDKTIPDADFDIFIFANPDDVTKVGWFLIMRSEDSTTDAIVDLTLLAGGQRVDPFPKVKDSSSPTIKGLIEQVKKGAGALIDKDKRGIIDAIKDKTLIRYNPASKWTTVIDSKLFGLLVLQFALRDPNLYGLRLNIGKIDIDALYRKLSEDLGVYSIEFVPPEAVRRFDVGPVTIILPAIGVDIYTDGGFRVDLGFNDFFKRGFVAEVFPFTGSAGVYFARVSGAGARLVPTINPLPVASVARRGKRKIALAGPPQRIFEYNPVTEVGFAGSFGIGKSIDKGVFTAEAKIEIYGFLEGSQGLRRQLIPNVTPAPGYEPAPRFTAVRGTLGIHGHVEGRVDFKVTRARAWADVTVDIIILFRNQHGTDLSFNATVSVGFEWVIARIETFFGTIEISIYLSFSTSVSYTWTLGTTIQHFDEIYGPPATSRLITAVAERFRARPINLAEADFSPIVWAPNFFPDYWKGAGRYPLPLVFNPDITFADDGFAQGKIVTRGPVFVALLWGQTRPADPQTAGAVSDMESLIVALTAWAIWSVWKDTTAGSPLQWKLTRDNLAAVARRIRGGDEKHDANPDAVRGPTYDALTQFFADNFVVTVNDPTNPLTGNTGALFPFPSDIAWTTKDGAGQTKTVNLWDDKSITKKYQDTLRTFFAELAIQAEDREQSKAVRPRVDQGRPFASVLFEEHIELLLRGGVDALDAAWLAAAKEVQEPMLSAVLGKLLDMTQPNDPSQKLRPAATVAAFVTRFFLHGLRVPLPDGNAQGGKRRDTEIETPDYAMVRSDKDSAAPVFSAALLQSDLGATQSISLAQRAYTRWFSVANSLSANVNPDAVNALKYAFGLITSDTLTFQTTTLPGWTARSNEYAPLTQLALSKTTTCLTLPADLIDGSCRDRPLKVEVRDADSSKQTAVTARHALAIPIRLKQVWDRVNAPKNDQSTAPTPIQYVYEILGAVEDDRRLLDLLVESWGADADNLVVELYAVTASGDQTSYTQVAGVPMVMRSNLSVEPRLDGADQAAAAVATSAGPQNSALITEIRTFIELVRFSSVVNSGGFHLLSDDKNLESIFTQYAAHDSGKPEGAQKIPTALMIVRRKPPAAQDAPEIPRVRNALLVDLSLAENGREQISAMESFDAGKSVVVIMAGTAPRSATLPGLLRLCVKMDDPRSMYAWTLKKGTTICGTFEELKPQILADEGYPDDKTLRALFLTRRGAGIVKADLLTRYTMLDFSISGDAFDATKSRKLLPVGPSKSADCHETKKLGYSVPIPLAKFLDPQKGDPTDPYGAVGKGCVISYSLRDVYGNRLGITGTYPIEKIQFTDPLLPFWNISGISSYFDIDPNHRAVSISLTFNVPQNPSTEGLQSILRDVKTSLIQLFIPSKLKTATAIRPYTKLLLETTLIKPESSGSASDLPVPGSLEITDPGTITALRDFLIRIRDSLAQAINPNPRQTGEVAPTTLSISLQASQLPSAADFVPLSVALVMTRDPGLVAQADEHLGLARTTTEIASIYTLPMSLEKRPRGRSRRRTAVDPRKDFADRLVKLWAKGTYLAAVGRAAEPGGRREVMWLVRALLTQPTIDYGNPVYAAPLPLANAPASFSFTDIPVYDDNFQVIYKTKWNLRDADVDLIGKTMATRIDLAVSPRIAGRLLAANLDSTLRLQVRQALESILDAKASIAEHFSNRVAPAYDTQNEQKRFNRMHADLTRDFRERLKRKLRSYFDIDVAVCCPVTWPASIKARDANDQRAPHLRVGVKRAEHAPRVRGGAAQPLDYATDEAPLPIGVTNAFSFFVDVNPQRKSDQLRRKSAQSGGDVLDVKLTYATTHVQRLRYPLSDKAALKERATQWLAFIEQPPATKDAKVPIILRKLPQQPTIIEQTVSFATVPRKGAFRHRIDLARQWTFAVDWGWLRHSHDELFVTAQYNSEPQNPANATAPVSVANAVAHFVAETDGALWQKLEELAAGESNGLADGTSAKAFIAFSNAAAALGGNLRSALSILAPNTTRSWKDSFDIQLIRNKLKITPSWDADDQGTRKVKPRPGLPKFGNLDRDGLSVSGVNVMEGTSAWSDLKVQSNVGFNPVFTYTVDGVRAGAALVPHVYRGVEEFEITAGTSASKSAEDWLVLAFTALFNGRPSRSAALHADVECLYQSKSLDDPNYPAFVHIRGAQPPGTPVGKLVGAVINATPQTLLDDIGQLAKSTATMVLDWLSANQVPMVDKRGRPKPMARRYKGQLRFRVTVFSPTGPALGAPILKIENLLLPLDKVALDA